MRELRQKRLFKDDLRRELKGRYRNILMPDGEFQNVVDMLRHDISLPIRFMEIWKAAGNAIYVPTCC